ncbi:hypothetical protein ACUXAV_005226, partial [Cupriavidus metallidurans]
MELLRGGQANAFGSPHLPLAIICMVSMPPIRMRAQRKFLNPSMGRARRLMARWPDGPMAMLDDVVQVLALTDPDGRLSMRIHG